LNCKKNTCKKHVKISFFLKTQKDRREQWKSSKK